MFNKDTVRLILKTRRRFISLFLIVLIGVGFMVGLLSTHIVMRESVDDYYDKNDVFDIQLYSTYGFNDDDVKALRSAEGIDKVYPSKFKDLYLHIDGYEGKHVTRLTEIDSELNHINLIEGRKPENDHEAVCLSPGSFGSSLKIGSKVKVFLEDEEDLSDYLKETEFEIVGIADAATFLSASKETSTLNNEALSIVLYVNNDVLVSKYYTSVYLTLDGAKELVTFEKEYKDYIENNIGAVELVKALRDGILKEEILKDVIKEIEDGEKELEDKKAEALEQIEDAENKLNEGYIKLIVGEQNIETLKTALDSTKKTLDDNKEELDRNKKTVDSAIKEIEDKSGKSFEEVVAETNAAYYTYISLEGQLGNTDAANEELDVQINNFKERRDNAQNDLISLKADEALKKNSYDNAKKAYEQSKNELELIAIDDPSYSEKELEVKALEQSMNQKETLYLDAKQKVTDKENEINDYTRTIERLELLKTQYNDENIEEILNSINESAGGDIKETYKEVNALASAKLQIEAGILEIEAGERAYNEALIQLKDAEKEVQKGRNEYNNGLTELKKAKAEFNDEIEKAEEKLANARQDLEELPEAEWIVLDRNSHYSSYMFEANADQMKAIGTYVPLLFFLVAALVCMTTMTRLIDEQRSQIGIFSALGFSKNRIISKYVVYAFAAAISGSVFGIFFGMALFPTVIYTCWKLMYNLPPMKIMLPLIPTVIGITSFTVLMMMVTYFVARNSLKEMPSQLMRPKAPKNARKVFLERISFIWNRLSFTTKITARNIIRYKSRFFMTVIGVAGCTGLLIVGFGVKDSITDILSLQYNKIFKYNNSIVLENDHEIDEIIEVLNDDLGNKEVVPFMSYSSMCYIEGEDDKAITVEVFNPREIKDVIELRTREGEEININGSGVILSEKFAKDHGYRKGDQIVIESHSGLKGTFKIDDICEFYINHYIFMSESVYYSAFKENVHHNKIGVITDNADNLNNAVKDFESVISVVDFKPMIDNFEHMLEALDMIILIIIVAAGSLAFVVLMNLTEVNISERIREIATLKVLGFRKGEVNMYIFKEITLLSLFGAILGLPLGKVEHHLIMDCINMEMARFGDRVAPLSYVYSFVITIVFTVIVLALMRKTLQKIEMVESLKSVE